MSGERSYTTKIWRQPSSIGSLERGRFIHLDGPSGRTRRLNLEETLQENTKQLRISGIGGSELSEPTKPTASTGFMERAMGIEPTSEAWEATQNTQTRSFWRLFCVFRFFEMDSNWILKIGRLFF